MIRHVLQMIAEGGIPLPELAAKIGLREPELKNRLEMMVRMGYLEAINITEVPEGELPCHGCLMAARCKDEDCSDGPPVVGYRLTEKGKRVAGAAPSLDKDKTPRAHSSKEGPSRRGDDARRRPR